jgi:urease accessory protein
MTDVVRVDAILGSSADDSWARRLDAARVDLVHIGQAEAQKSKIKTKSSYGTEVAVSLDRGTLLRDGDVLHWDQASRTAIVARVDLEEVLVIDLSALAARPVAEAMSQCVELGHALGNQHWPAVIKGLHAYVPLAIAREVMASVINTHGFTGISYSFAPGADVAGCLTPGEARRLFGTVAGHAHDGAGR